MTARDGARLDIFLIQPENILFDCEIIAFISDHSTIVLEVKGGTCRGEEISRKVV